MRGAVFADLNNHGYTDLFLFRDDGPPLVFENRGEDKFLLRRDKARCWRTRWCSTRRWPILTTTVTSIWPSGRPTGCHVLFNRRNWKFAPLASMPALSPPAGPFAFRGAVADLNGDSFPDLLAADASGKVHFLVNRAGRFREGSLTLPAENQEPLASLAAGVAGKSRQARPARHNPPRPVAGL